MSLFHTALRRPARTFGSALLISLLASSAMAQTFSRTVVFGDSLSDNGNLANLTGNAPGAPGYPSRRFSNGQVWVEYLAGPLDNFNPLAATPIDNSRSVDLAFGGARTDFQTSPPSIQVQTGAYLARGGRFGANDLVTLWGGANNIFQGLPGALGNPATAQTTMATVSAGAATDIANTTNLLAASGARTIVVFNLPDIGLAPAFNTTAAAPLATFSSVTFNTALSSNLAGVAASQPGSNIILVNEAGIFSAIIANPGAFGFTNVTQACVRTACLGQTTAQQNQYLFWDDVHPTTAGHALIAQAVQQYLWAPTLALYSGSLAETAFNDRRTAALRGFERLRDQSAKPGVNDFYVNVVGDFGQLKTSVSRPGYSWSVGGVNFGVTRAINSAFSLGLAGNITTGSVESGPNKTVSYDATNFSADLLASWRQNGVFVNAALGVGAAAFTDWKRKTFVGPLENTASPSGMTASAVAEIGYDAKFGALTVTPAARIGYIHANSNGFTETGILAPIKYNSRSIDAVTGAVELRGAYEIMRDKERAVALFALVGYEDFLSYSRGSVRGVLAGNVSQAFATAIGRPAGEGVQLGGGLTGEMGNLRLNAEYRVSIAATRSEGTRHRASVGLRFAF